MDEIKYKYVDGPLDFVLFQHTWWGNSQVFIDALRSALEETISDVNQGIPMEKEDVYITSIFQADGMVSVCVSATKGADPMGLELIAANYCSKAPNKPREAYASKGLLETVKNTN